MNEIWVSDLQERPVVWVAVEDDREMEAEAADRILGVFGHSDDARAACRDEWTVHVGDSEAQLEWHGSDDEGGWHAEGDPYTSYEVRRMEVYS